MFAYFHIIFFFVLRVLFNFFSSFQSIWFFIFILFSVFRVFLNFIIIIGILSILVLVLIIISISLIIFLTVSNITFTAYFNQHFRNLFNISDFVTSNFFNNFIVSIMDWIFLTNYYIYRIIFCNFVGIILVIIFIT